MLSAPKIYFVLSSVVLLPYYSVAQISNETFSTVRVELAPDVNTTAGDCTQGFLDSLNDQMMPWFIDAVASYKRTFPQAADPNATFTNTVVLGVPTSRRRESVMFGERSEEKGEFNDEDERDTQESQQDQGEQPKKDRKLCSNSSCTNCCAHYCSVYCIGLCKLCSKDDDDVRNRRRRRDVEALAWWWGDQALQNGVSQLVQFSAQKWLFQNDPNGLCMGDPWKMQVVIIYT